MLVLHAFYLSFFFFKQKTAYEMRISDCSSDVCSSDLAVTPLVSATSTRPLTLRFIYPSVSRPPKAGARADMPSVVKVWPPIRQRTDPVLPPTAARALTV